MGEAYGGDGRSIILTHALRVFLVVMTVPVYFRFVEKLDVPPMAIGKHVWELLPVEAALLIAVMGFVATVALSKYLQRGDIIEY